MNTISISALKSNPAKAINQASLAPVAVKKRDKTMAYLIGQDLYEKLVSYIEDYIDVQAVKDVDFSQGKDFEEVAKELGI